MSENLRHIQKECLASIPSCWEDKEAYHITNVSPFEVEDPFHRWKEQDQYVPDVHNPQEKGGLFV